MFSKEGERVGPWSSGLQKRTFQEREILAHSVSVPLSCSLSPSGKPRLGGMLEIRASPPYPVLTTPNPSWQRGPSSFKPGLLPLGPPPNPVHRLHPPEGPGVVWLLSDSEIKVSRRWKKRLRDFGFLSVSLKRPPPAVFLLREALGRRMVTFLSSRDN